MIPKPERKQYSPQYQFKPSNSARIKKKELMVSAYPQNPKVVPNNVEIELRFSIKTKKNKELEQLNNLVKVHTDRLVGEVRSVSAF